VETVSIALGGVPIHFYVTVDMDVVVEIVNIMGGIWLDVPERTYHVYGHIIAEPGYQRFDGNRFLDYVRSREASGGDAQRAKKQQDVMIEVFEQFKKANKLVNAPQVLTSVRNNITTNLSLEQIMALALFGTQKVDTNNISQQLLEGTYARGGIPSRRSVNIYYLINQLKRVELVKNIWGIDIVAGPTDVLLPPLEKDDEVGNPSDPPYDPIDPLEPGEDPGDDDQDPGDDDPGAGDPGDGDPGDDE